MLLQRRLYRVQFPDADDIAWVGAYDAFDTSSLLQSEAVSDGMLAESRRVLFATITFLRTRALNKNKVP
jgi:hypothetical protein